ncbi:MAG: hypothetical protein ARM1_0372 [Candidatus Micrarchaeota archaeon]|nr:MAG: hypothetical protein ARM1_0372 [Candidatus Micrarchaeota archaeon]
MSSIFTQVSSAIGFFDISVVAILISFLIVAIMYAFGAVIDNNEIKERAVSEFANSVYSIVLLVAIFAFLLFFANVYISAISTTSYNNYVAYSCNSLEGSQLPIIQNKQSQASLIYQLCNLYLNLGQLKGRAYQIDYPISTAAITLANMSNQTFSNTVDIYSIQSYIYYLSGLKAIFGICTPTAGCFAYIFQPKGSFQTPSAFGVRISYAPYLGLRIAYSSISPIADGISFAMNFMLGLLLIITIFIYAWPYLLAFGIILRTLSITRMVGGLLIAAIPIILLVLPTLFAIEYIAFNNAQSNNIYTNILGTDAANVLGYNIPQEKPNGQLYYYQLNLFDEPNIAYLANALNCSTGSNLLSMTSEDFGYLLIPFSSLFSSISSIINQQTKGVPTFYLPNYCSPKYAPYLVFYMARAYGIIASEAFILILFNLIIIVSGTSALSGLFGGDVGIAGLSKLL